MAHLHGLRAALWFLLGFFFMLVLGVASVRAETVAATPTYLWRLYDTCSGSGTSYVHASADIACNQQSWCIANPGRCGVNGSNQCTIDGGNIQGCTIAQQYFVASGYTCPTGQGWTLSGISCTRPDCLAGQTRDANGVCTADCASKAQKTYYGCVEAPWNYPGGSYPQGSSEGGCASIPQSISAGYRNTTTQAEMWCGDWKYSGQPSDATSAVNVDASTQPTTCGSGQCLGTVNGVSMCLACSDASQNTAAAGTTTTSTGGGSSQPGGSTSTTTVTNNYNSTTNTVTTTINTTTVTNNAGTPSTTTSQQTTDQPLSTYCASHPTDKLCQGSSSGKSSSDCLKAPECKGDGVQCAILEQSWRNMCDTHPSDALNTTVQAALDGTDGKNATAKKDNSGTFNMPTLDQSDSLPASNGLIDLQVPVRDGFVLTVPFSRINPYLQAMGYVVLTFSFLLAARIMFRRAA